jgi:predicted nucleic acid-binding protein
MERATRRWSAAPPGMIVHVDTSALVDALTGPRRSLDTLIGLIDGGHRLALSTLVLYEWLRGPRARAELAAQEDLFPSEHAVVFGPAEAAVAARLYKTMAKARGREIDLAVAACALANGAAIWTLNSPDFRDIPGLRLV